MFCTYITLKAKSQKNFLKMSKPKNIAPFMADFRALFTTKVLYSYKCSNNNKMNISEYIHKMTDNQSFATTIAIFLIQRQLRQDGK